MKSRRAFFKTLLGITLAPKVVEAVPVVAKPSQPGVFPRVLTLTPAQEAQMLYEMKLKTLRLVYQYRTGLPVTRATMTRLRKSNPYF